MYNTLTFSAPAPVNVSLQPARRAQRVGCGLASPADREQFLALLALNAHFNSVDIADLRELLSQYPVAAVYNAVQRACQQRLHDGGNSAARDGRLSKVLLSPLFHLACRTQLPAQMPVSA
ncbi:hypothetical protein GCM10027048_36400 [Hymenobacter coalescens]